VTFPQIVLIIGTDASGKDHIAAIVEKMIREAGGEVEKRKRFLAGRRTLRQSSAAKSWFELCLERGFLFCFPYLGWMLPWFAALLLRRDLRKLRLPSGKLVIVGHNCLRGLAFYWGHRYASVENIRISAKLEEVLVKMGKLPGLHTLVLDVDDSLRQSRIKAREMCGQADFFDRYLAMHQEKSERIESMLVWLCKHYLNAQLIENNDLGEAELRRLIAAGFSGKVRPGRRSPGN